MTISDTHVCKLPKCNNPDRVQAIIQTVSRGRNNLLRMRDDRRVDATTLSETIRTLVENVRGLCPRESLDAGTFSAVFNDAHKFLDSIIADFEIRSLLPPELVIEGLVVVCTTYVEIGGKNPTTVQSKFVDGMAWSIYIGYDVNQQDADLKSRVLDGLSVLSKYGDGSTLNMLREIISNPEPLEISYIRPKNY